jgi:hypothetical protein
LWKNADTFINLNDGLSLPRMNYVLTLFITLLALTTSAQNRPQPTYARDWKRADSLAAKGLPKSALAIADRIYKEAKATTLS